MRQRQLHERRGLRRGLALFVLQLAQHVRGRGYVATEPGLDARFAVLADPGVDVASVARLPGVSHVLAALREQEGVRFDPAGGSLLIMSRGIFVSGNRTSAHADSLVRAVCELGGAP